MKTSKVITAAALNTAAPATKEDRAPAEFYLNIGIETGDPQFPFLDYPYVVALVDLDEGVRLVSNLVDIAPEDAWIDMPVEVCFAEFDGDLVLHRFRPRRDA